jgi:hypothetical protein
MLILMLKYIKILKILRHVSILTDHHQGVGLYLVKVTELFKNLKNTESKILTINPGVMAATALHCTSPHGSPRTPATRIAATTPGMIFRILNSVFFK